MFVQVRRAGRRFGEPIPRLAAAGDDDDRCDPGAVQLERVIEPGGEHR